MQDSFAGPIKSLIDDGKRNFTWLSLRNRLQENGLALAFDAKDRLLIRGSTLNSPHTLEADIAIVGAGAAGLMAAICAGRSASKQKHTPKILILEGSKKLGRKILISGGGRCNVTNRCVSADDYAGGPRNAIKKVLKRFDASETAEFFRELGIEFHIEEDTGKLFPVSNRASSVLNALLREAKKYASIHHPCRVESVAKDIDSGQYLVRGEWGSLRTPRLVLATGGKSIPKTGSDGHGFKMVAELGHTTTPLVLPALVPITLPREHFICGLSGVTLRAALELWSPTGKRLQRFDNSTLCTHFGLSGPGPLDISRYFLAAKEDDESVQLTLNWIPDLNEDELCVRLRAEKQRRPAAFLRDYLPERIVRAILELWRRDAELSSDEEQTVCQQLSKKNIRSLARLVTKTPLPATGSRGFNFAEATAGGVPLSEIQLKTMESRVQSGLYLCGEICDVDGRIGGFNFQWAWSSGYVAGVSVASSLR